MLASCQAWVPNPPATACSTALSRPVCSTANHARARSWSARSVGVTPSCAGANVTGSRCGVREVGGGAAARRGGQGAGMGGGGGQRVGGGGGGRVVVQAPVKRRPPVVGAVDGAGLFGGVRAQQVMERVPPGRVLGDQVG